MPRVVSAREEVVIELRDQRFACPVCATAPAAASNDGVRGTCSQCPGMMNSFFPSMRFLPVSIMSNIFA
jgi:hypothetical protein